MGGIKMPTQKNWEAYACPLKLVRVSISEGVAKIDIYDYDLLNRGNGRESDTPVASIKLRTIDLRDMVREARRPENLNLGVLRVRREFTNSHTVSALIPLPGLEVFLAEQQ